METTNHAGHGHDIIGRIVAIFARHGARSYLGESVSMSEHMLQTATAAERDGAPASLIAAALLHDIGLFTDELVEPRVDQRIDGGHEAAGGRFLEPHFGPYVTEPVRLHVAAKRYLCAVETDYVGGLTPASLKTLALQGGPMSPEAAEGFAATPYADAAVALRRWDDQGKVAGLLTPRLDHYLPLLEALLTA